MRPRGEIREALFQAAERYADSGAHWRDLAAAACVGYSAARDTVRNMARAGELADLGAVLVQGANRPMRLYAPASAAAGRHGGDARALTDIVRCWADFR